MTRDQARAELQTPTCRILDAMVWLETGRIPMPWHRSLVAYSANHLPRAGAFRGYVAKLKALELVSYRDGGLVLEHQGRELAVSPERETGHEFSRELYWQILDGHLGPIDRRICMFLREVHNPVSRHALMDIIPIGVIPVAEFRTATAKLIAVGLVTVENDAYSRTGVLYPESVFEIRARRGEVAVDPKLEDPTV